MFIPHFPKAARGCRFAAALILALVFGSSLHAQETDDVFPRLAATLDAEPLALIAFHNAKEIPEKFAATTLSKMINDPQYERGAQFIDSKVAELFGASPRSAWPEFEKVITGPLMLAILPGTPQTPNDKNPPLRVVFLVQVNEADVGQAIKQQWPVLSSMINSGMRSFIQNVQPGGVVDTNALVLLPAELKILATAELPPAMKFPAWVSAAAWPKSDIVLRAKPIQICAAARGGVKPAPNEKPAPTGTLIDAIDGSGLDAMVWSISFVGGSINEQLTSDLSDEDSVFKKFIGAMRESSAIASWDGLMAATPGDVDGVVMFQSDLTKLGDDLPHIFESVERYLRGKRWARAFGTKSEALDPARFKYLISRMQGSFGVVAKPAITGELRLTVTSSIKTKPTEEKPEPGDPYKGNDTEKFRDELLKGLETTGAKFETLIGARKIGGALPLAAAFHGRGQFAAPVIGLSPGWAWLCSSSVAYQELTDAFKMGKTLAAREKKRAANTAPDKNPAGAQANPNMPPASVLNEWGPEDALRAEVNLDRVLKIGYAAWLLGNNEGPAIGNHRVPSELLPPPQVFSRALGRLRASANRTGKRVECRSSCAFPGVTLIMLGMLQDASESISTGRRLAADAKKAAPTIEEEPEAPKKPAEKSAEKSADKPAKPDDEKVDGDKPEKASPPAKESK